MTTQTTTESTMQRIERAERAALVHDREDPTERRDREQAERDALAEAQRAERDAIAEAEREAAATALVTEQAAQARATQLAEDAADELRIQRVLALARIINQAESTLQPQIDKAQVALDKAIGDGTDVGALYLAWSTLRTASAELWNTTVEARRSIAMAKGETLMDGASIPAGPLDGLSFESVLTMALDARTAPTLATIKAAVAAAYTDADAAPTTRRRRR
jgi:hypothetical protein